MIKVLHVNSTIYMNSGVMSVIMNYYKNINKEKIQFDFLYFKKMQSDVLTYEDIIKNNGGKVFSCPYFKNLIRFNKELDRILKENNYDIIHIHDAFILKFIVKTIRKYKNIKIIVHSHATKWSDKRISSIRNKILCYKICNYADYLFACSEAAGKFMFGKKNFYIVKNAIEVNKYLFNGQNREEKRKNLNIIKSQTVIGHVGNFNKQKNHIFLIELFEKILDYNKNYVLVLIGDGATRPKIEEIVKNKRIEENVIFLGKRSDVDKFYSAMDIFVLPSLYEGLPMVGVEAQCNGLPVVFSKNITKEVKINDCQFVSLESGSALWATKILSTKVNSNEDRIKAKKCVIDKGFDIHNESEKLMNKYERIVKR